MLQKELVLLLEVVVVTVVVEVSGVNVTVSSVGGGNFLFVQSEKVVLF